MVGEFFDGADGDGVQDGSVVGEPVGVEGGDVVAVDQVEVEKCVFLLDRAVERGCLIGQGCDVGAGLGQSDRVSEKHEGVPSLKIRCAQRHRRPED
ncbi:MAG TPA: hypothetical protein VIR30_07970 [Nocardioides sp.]